MDADLDILATALYVRVDDLLKMSPDRLPARPQVGIEPRMATRPRPHAAIWHNDRAGQPILRSLIAYDH